MRTVAVMALLAACGSAPNEKTCKSICDKAVDAALEAVDPKEGATEVKLTAFEHKLLRPMLEDIREGVRPWDDQSLGICKLEEGKRDCVEFLGMDPGMLPAGRYQLYGEFRAPDAGDKADWKLELETTCTVTRGEQVTERPPRTQTYEIPYSGTKRGYRIAPMQTIQSPSEAGGRTCTWKVTAKNPDGDKEWSGGWAVPEK